MYPLSKAAHSFGFFMATYRRKNSFKTRINVLQLISTAQSHMARFPLMEGKAKIVILVASFSILFILGARMLPGKKTADQTLGAKSNSVSVNRNFDFNAYTAQGRLAPIKMKVSISSAEKTNQVLVKDQTFTAKNNKLFLIVNIELKNDSTQVLNITPGDLFRLAYAENLDTKYAPDLHNNVVPVAPISTRPDRLGFVVPQDGKDFKLYVGELEGKKEEIALKFGS